MIVLTGGMLSIDTLGPLLMFMITFYAVSTLKQLSNYINGLEPLEVFTALLKVVCIIISSTLLILHTQLDYSSPVLGRSVVRRLFSS